MVPNFVKTYYVVIHKTSSDATLRELSVKDHNIEPEFKPEVKGYTLDVESYNKEAVIHARANHDHVRTGTRVTLLGFRNGVDKYQIGSELVEINEKVSLAYGSNNFEIRVISSPME